MNLHSVRNQIVSLPTGDCTTLQWGESRAPWAATKCTNGAPTNPFAPRQRPCAFIERERNVLPEHRSGSCEPRGGAAAFPAPGPDRQGCERRNSGVKTKKPTARRATRQPTPTSLSRRDFVDAIGHTPEHHQQIPGTGKFPPGAVEQKRYRKAHEKWITVDGEGWRPPPTAQDPPAALI